MLLILIISGCLCILSVLSVMAKVLPVLRGSVLAYGKLINTTQGPRKGWVYYFSTWTVPKPWFAHFYLVGLTFSIYCWLELRWARSLGTTSRLGPLLDGLQRWDSSGGSHRVDWSICVVGHGLMTCHLARRLFECWFIEHPSPRARMHVSHYLLGIGFYGAMVFGTWLEGVGALSLWKEDYQPQQHSLSISYTVLGLALFLYASKHQYQCHSILAALRSGNDKKKEDNGGSQYRVPYGDWFEFLVAPHYTCDVLIYVSLCIIYQGQSIILICGLIWTLVNLSVVASETKVWYMTNFSTFPKHRWIMVPGLY